jgi:hypothetical protein
VVLWHDDVGREEGMESAAVEKEVRREELRLDAMVFLAGGGK